MTHLVRLTLDVDDDKVSGRRSLMKTQVQEDSMPIDVFGLDPASELAKQIATEHQQNPGQDPQKPGSVEAEACGGILYTVGS